MKSSQQAKLAEKTDYRKSIEYLARLAQGIEDGHLLGDLCYYDTESKELAKHIRRVLHGARG